MDVEKHIRGSIKGNERDQRKIFDTYSGRMLKLCQRYLKNKQDAEDAFIKAFNKVFLNLIKFEYRGKDSLSKWMSTIMVNECLMILRQGFRLEKIDENTPSPLVENDSFNSDTDYIYELILKLPLGYRTVFNLFAIEGYSHKEIATLLGITEGTSKSQLNKARHLLQGQLNNKNLDYGT